MNLSPHSRILIIGCGWLGRQLGAYLSDQGYMVTGTTRSVDNFEVIATHGIEPAILDVDLNLSKGLIIPKYDVVFISLTPGRKEGRKDYPMRLEHLAKALAHQSTLIYQFSSISAYTDTKGILTEEAAQPDVTSDNPILAGEGMIRKHLPEATILRLAGLYGKDRHPVHHLAGRKDLADGYAPVNLIHAEDIIQICDLLMNQAVEGEIYNICSVEHPSKSVLYTALAKELGLETPVFNSGGEKGKIIDASKVLRQLHYTLKHPNPAKLV